MATLLVNLTQTGNACAQDATPAGAWPHNGWYVFLCDCKGSVFTYAGREYGPFPVDHGYVEIKDVPTGKYILFAIVNPFPIVTQTRGGVAVWQANYASHYAVVEVCCKDKCGDVCVTLYNSGWHYCVQVILHLFSLLEKGGKLDAKVAGQAREVLNAALKAAGEIQPTDMAAIRQLEKITDTFLAAGGRPAKK